MNASQEPAPHQPGERPAPETSAVGYGYGAGYELAHPAGPVEQRGLFGRAWNPGMSSHRPWKRTLTVAVVSFLVIVVLGGPLGLLWRALAPSVPVIDAGQSGVVINDPSPEEFVAADGLFTLLGLGFGLLVAIAAWFLLRRDRGPFLLLSVVLGTLGAGWLVAPRVGELIGRSDYESWIETAQQGATYMAPPEVHSLGPTLVPAFAAAIVLTLMAGWSNDPDLDQPGAKPGYGPNNPDAGYPGPDQSGPGYPGPDAAGPGYYGAGPHQPGSNPGDGYPHAERPAEPRG
ncbi:hypothetical protein Aab01nite_40830 [Paractinoplanes abujensis]|uniref:DUF2567 domain-containing protein n=1 Tax=Paractinoplanes abujensis TaxID=882441 RepID=A0A7W7CTV9_9ACTN|nr:hypothetical protein [Actinoplanes abujensis]MBB4694294.1 hypothetical protein [Actinoplanes abujensis]GID20493.1 hypothetical protein Aab01nite_40830 [Actinoplanes abujensis]